MKSISHQKLDNYLQLSNYTEHTEISYNSMSNQHHHCETTLTLKLAFDTGEVLLFLFRALFCSSQLP